MSDADPLTQSAESLAGAERVVALTGAGMSQESGVPTFRDALTGLWSRYDPKQLATPEAFARNPKLVFDWYFERWQRARAVSPHAGHDALVQLASRFEQFTVVTQNIDGLHQRAGSTDVIELHGSLEAFRCNDGGHPWDPAQFGGLVGTDHSTAAPTCDACGSVIRPGVVWFGESLPADAVRAAWASVEAADAVLVVGSSAIVYPAAELPLVAERQGASVIEINPDRTPLSQTATVAWIARAGVALPALAKRLEGDGNLMSESR